MPIADCQFSKSAIGNRKWAIGNLQLLYRRFRGLSGFGGAGFVPGAGVVVVAGLVVVVPAGAVAVPFVPVALFAAGVAAGAAGVEAGSDVIC